MGAIDITSLLASVMPENPCGGDLRADTAYFELESASRGKPTRFEGQNEIPAEDPNWAQVRTLAEELLARSKDLRVVLHLVRSLVRLESYAGLEAGLALLCNLTVDHWKGVHPRLDPEDKNDPTERLNIFAELTDSENLLRYVRFAPIVFSREFGHFSLRDYDIASGKQSVPSNVIVPKLATIDACFLAAEIEAIQSCRKSIAESIGHVKVLEETLTKHLSRDQSIVSGAPAIDLKTAEKVLDLAPLSYNLASAQKILDAALKKRGVVTAVPVAQGGSENPGEPRPAQGFSGGQITAREDCIKAIDLVIDYFKKHERSSPLPLLLERAKKLMGKDFMEIMQDLAPDGVSQASKVFGTEPKKN